MQLTQTASPSLFFRVDILDVAILPTKLNDIQVLTHLQRFLVARWAATYKHIELKPIVHDPKSTSWATGGSRVTLPLFITLEDWISFVGGPTESTTHQGGRLHLSTSQKRAYWVRFAVVLHSLQQADLIRDAVKLQASKEVTLDKDMFEKSLIEFRYFSILLWMQCWRVIHVGLTANVLPTKATGFGATPEVTPRSQGRQRSVSDGAIDGYSLARKSAPEPLHSRSPKYATLSPRGLLTKYGGGGLSPSGTQLDELAQSARDLFTRSLPTLLCLIGFHLQHISVHAMDIADVTRLDGETPDLAKLYLSTGHFKFLSLLLQLRQPSLSAAEDETLKRQPVNSKALEKTLYTELLNAKAMTSTQVAPLVSVNDFVHWFETSISLEIASTDALTSSFLTSSSSSVHSSLPSRAYYRGRTAESAHAYAKVNMLFPKSGSVDELDAPSSSESLAHIKRERRAVMRYRSASADHILISGKKKEIFFLSTNSTTRCNVSIIDCSDCVVYATSLFAEVKIVNVRNSRLVFACVSGTVSVHFSKNISLHAASVGCLISNAYDVKAYILCATPPVIVGDTRDLSVAPYNVEYSGQLELLAAANMGFRSSLSNWCSPIVFPLGSIGRISTPRDTIKSDYIEEGMTPTVLKPQEFDILHLPFDTTQFPITSGHLVLPEKYVKVYQDERNRRQLALADFLKKVAACTTPEIRRAFLNRVEARFGEWLQNSRKYNDLVLLNREPHDDRNRSRPQSEIEGI
eukprot:Blabericola_migrator_1__1851@NODE_1501_length_4402_cov_191_113033_g984_i0_p1_GENE_NODE_1501_length_4402_cov_191_113033_g984_i0NODE_1501_length_4402_cov_191_113033_g984_i0_p1_ORF_typecomplete_len746_score94_23TBCC/PF07986_12/4_9e19CAP_C/PF08603_11/8_4e03CAP_C/PF08603_11/4_3e03CAP_C/PF08603_11/0_041_NODE_1501_length_4402_cov_191_113033_g984_i010313268